MATKSVVGKFKNLTSPTLWQTELRKGLAQNLFNVVKQAIFLDETAFPTFCKGPPSFQCIVLKLLLAQRLCISLRLGQRLILHHTSTIIHSIRITINC